MKTYNQPVVIRRPLSNKTHVVTNPGRIGLFSQLGSSYWGVDDCIAACGAKIESGSVIMQAETPTRCRACVHVTGVTEQSPVVFETLGDPR